MLVKCRHMETEGKVSASSSSRSSGSDYWSGDDVDGNQRFENMVTMEKKASR